MDRIKRHTKRWFVALVGAIIVLIGLILVPYPGPGWLIVFSGFALLATEFAFAGRALEKLRSKYDYWIAWLKRQSRVVQWMSALVTGIVLLLTGWLLNTFGLINAVLGLGWDWLRSPFF